MIYQLETHIAQQLKDFFDNYDFIDKVVIFGSRAKHTANPKSDIDLCIYSLEMSDEQFSKLRFELDELPILYKLDIVHFEKVNRELQNNVEKDGKLLYQKYVNLFSICRPKQHKTISKNKLLNDGAYNVYGANGIIGKYDKYTHEEKTLLITCRGATSGYLNISEPKAYVNGNAMALDDLSKKVNLKYLYYFLSNRKLNDVISGSAQPQITRENLQIVQVYLPTLTKQKKIAKVLDRANELITLRKESIEKLDKLSKSIFIDMFGDPVLNPKGWEMGTLRDLLKKVNYGTSSKANVNKVGIPILRMNNITYSGHLDILDLKFIELSKKDEEKYILDKGDILFNRTNSKELVGKTTVFNLNEKYSFAGYLIRAKVNKNANPYFVSYFLNSEYGKLVLLNKAKSIVGMANINAQEMQNISCYIPPITLQDKFANIIEEIEEQKASYEQQLKLLEDNFNSLLQRSFS